MLEAERNSDNRYAEEDSEAQMHQSNLNTSDKNPYYIHYERQAASVIGVRLDFMSERPEREARELYQLESERDSDNCYAEEYSHNKIVEADQKSAEYHPQNVS